MQLVLAMLVSGSSSAATMNTGPDMALVPFRSRRLEVSSSGSSNDPFVGVTWSLLHQTGLVDDAQKLLDQEKTDDDRVCPIAGGCLAAEKRHLV